MAEKIYFLSHFFICNKDLKNQKNQSFCDNYLVVNKPSKLLLWW